MCDFLNQLVWLVLAHFTSMKSKKYTYLKYPKHKAKATIGRKRPFLSLTNKSKLIHQGFSKKRHKPDPLGFFENGAWA